MVAAHISQAITKLTPSTSAPSLTWQPFKLLALQKSAVFFLPTPSSCHPFSQASHLSTGSNVFSVLVCLSDKLSGSLPSSSMGRSLAATQEGRNLSDLECNMLGPNAPVSSEQTQRDRDRQEQEVVHGLKAVKSLHLPGYLTYFLPSPYLEGKSKLGPTSPYRNLKLLPRPYLTQASHLPAFLYVSNALTQPRKETPSDTFLTRNTWLRENPGDMYPKPPLPLHLCTLHPYLKVLLLPAYQALGILLDALDKEPQFLTPRFSPTAVTSINSHVETRGTRIAGVFSPAVDLAKHQTHKVAIFPTTPSNPPEPGSFTLATYSHPVNSTRPRPALAACSQSLILVHSPDGMQSHWMEKLESPPPILRQKHARDTMGNGGAHPQTQGILNLIHQPVLFFLLSLSLLLNTLDEAHAKILTMIPSLAAYPPRPSSHGFLPIDTILGPVR
ncbi:uncharacterized protein CLUP02_09052 [Colletotrichum lupini]|uniref:Uncharacterized protein n=4 Tax=Colletotrichum acutatum species complex TaxID=2707335 RepID=A0A9Q8WH78_9PEZI|nr:uncharacterized protein CLUP02_09052 [Colletotrichum lupini]UQC83558.1 hypothetical protein CLUP02_09052 [Colletotrichum lupini]